MNKLLIGIGMILMNIAFLVVIISDSRGRMSYSEMYPPLVPFEDDKETKEQETNPESEKVEK